MLGSFRRGLSARLRGVRIDPYLWLVVAFSAFAALPLAGPDYFFKTHDGLHSVFFFTEFDAALRDGVWYPGWGTDHAFGYGYPTFVVYSPLAFYVAEGFHLLGAGKVVAVKWTWALATVGAGLAMYAYGRHLWGRARGLLAAVVYVYAPYHLLDIYVRGALAEYCAFVWMPLALLAFHRLVDEVSLRHLARAGLAYGALWMTHNVTALAFTPVLAAYVLYRLPAGMRPGQGAWKRLGLRAAAAAGGALLAVGIAAALLLPNLLERGYISQEQWTGASYDYARHFVYPHQLLSPFWGYGAAGPGPVDEMAYQLGAVPLILAVAGVLGALGGIREERGLRLFYAMALLLTVLMVLPVSLPVWQVLPVATLIQFPWRLLAPAAAILAVLAGAGLPRREPGTRPVWAMVLAVAVCLGSFSYTLPDYTPVPAYAEGPQLVLDFESRYPDMVGMTAWTEEQPPTSPLVEQYRAGRPLVTAEALAPGAEVEMIRAGGASDELWVRSAAGTELRFYTYYFPGWRVYVNGERLPKEALRPAPPYGLLAVNLPPGEHRVLLRWGDTPVRAAGKAATVSCLILALVLALRRRREP